MLDQVIWENSIQRWLISAAIIVASLVVGSIVVALVRNLAKRTQSTLPSLIAEEIGGPTLALVGIFGLRIAVESLAMPENLHDLIAKGTTFGAGIVLTWLIVRTYEALHKGVLLPYANKPESRIELHVFVVLQTFATVLAWTVGIASAFSSIGFEVTAVLAGLGIGGVAIAFASQDTVANLFGGLIVLTQRPFKIGDRIEVNGVDGWVTRLGFRTTIIKNWYGREVSIPNTQFTNNILINIDTQSCYYQEIRLKLDPRTTTEEIERVLVMYREIIAGLDMLDADTWENFSGIGDGFYELEFWYAVTKWTPSDKDTYDNWYTKVSAAKTAVNIALLRELEAARIRLALPMHLHWNVEIDGGTGPKGIKAPRTLRPLPSAT